MAMMESNDIINISSSVKASAASIASAAFTSNSTTTRRGIGVRSPISIIINRKRTFHAQLREILRVVLE